MSEVAVWGIGIWGRTRRDHATGRNWGGRRSRWAGFRLAGPIQTRHSSHMVLLGHLVYCEYAAFTRHASTYVSLGVFLYRLAILRSRTVMVSSVC